MQCETSDQEIARLKKELAAVRRSAREMHTVIGWARGQFGSICIATEPEHLNGVIEIARDGYEKMEEAIANVHYRAQLWVVDKDTGSYKPRSD